MSKQIATIAYKDRYGALVAAVIQDYLKRLIYAPLKDAIKGTPIKVKLSVADTPEQRLIDKLQSGKINYDGQFFTGKFDSITTKIIKELGGVYDRKQKGFKLTPSRLTPSLRSAISASKARFEIASAKIQQVLDDAQDNINIDISGGLNKAVNKIIDGLQIQTVRSMEDIGVKYTLTHGQRENILKNYVENIDTQIKEWAGEHIKTLRKDVQQNALDGYRAQELEEMIEHRYGVSKNKARFIARQETSTFMSEFRKERFVSAGIDFFRWDTVGDRKVRDDHRKLNNLIFSYDDPPIVDSATGKRGLPGADFNCRCVDRPILEPCHKVGGKWEIMK